MMMKRFVSLIACLLLVCFAGAAMAESFTATAAGFGGDVTVTLTIDGTNLTDAKIDGAGETPTIGGGGAGLTAAISAREAGANVILVEKLSFLGGCPAMSGGVILRAAIETDSEEDMNDDALYEFLMNESEHRADAAVVRKYIDSSVDTFNWIYDKMVKHPENVQRYPMIPETLVANRLPGRGPEIMGDIADYAYSLGADIRLEVAATELIEENGKVVGAVVRYADGGEQKIYANAGVVLATGGFASSKEKLAQYSTPGAEKVTSNASAGTVGDGLDMAEKVGAVVRFTDDWDTCGATFAALALSPTGYDMGLLHKIMILNSNGERFINEANIQPTIYTEMRRQLATGVENEFWFVFDDNIDSNTQWLVDNVGAVKAETVEDLAALIGTPVEILQATIDAYNAVAGTDNDEFGKQGVYNVGIQAPFTVMLTTPMRTTTIGGLCITPDAEVLKADGSVVEGLYAAGELANSNFYGTIYTCGSAYGHAVIYGRIAGASAAANLK